MRSKALQQMSQSPDAPIEQGPRPLHVPDRPRKGWRTVRELRDELRFSSDDACRKWLRREGIMRVRRGKDGRVILIDGVDVDRALRGR